jgi:predicted heme/steroid binding protein
MQKYFYIFLLIPLFALGAGCGAPVEQTYNVPSDDAYAPANSVDEETGEISELNDSEVLDSESASITDNSESEDLNVAEGYYTMEEVAKHDNKDDCWLVINGKVYDVTEFNQHPGGDAILEGCGQDATELFNTRPMGSGTPHSENARGYLTNWEIGTLQ